MKIKEEVVIEIIEINSVVAVMLNTSRSPVIINLSAVDKLSSSRSIY